VESGERKMDNRIKPLPIDNDDAKRKSQFLEVLKRLSYNRGAVIGGVIFLLVVIVAIVAPLIMPYGYDTVDVKNRFVAPCAAHPFGTDHLGRDVFSRILYGAKFSISIGIGSIMFSSSLGIIFGSIAGFFGKMADEVIMRLCDVIQSIPGMILNIALACMLGPGVFNTIIALGLGGISGTARLTRASILKVRRMEYLDAAESINCSNPRIISRHILPNSFAPLLVQATMGVGARILDTAALSFIGIGVQPPLPEWGAMLAAGRNFIKDYPYLTLFPGLCIMTIVLSLNLLGDGLRDALDPKLKK
jgi:ABC-type dipeptide/oligopeptide/nickel transport system permease subunit